ncbi:hypothetical protein U2F26_27110 [Micromonospora sp. 4G57]|jgi:hypothetical protein|uniref:Thioesterase n=1 Tax=Micromonospora sicca TaxID=2202420 RepID=A0ABU5JLE4_9ACTN|nr:MULTISPECIES: hypothetical protein [unclassified Micromonospora]MDZ5446361.1 hypothetical protein [Micromonospora sp. 4G57]MDZ5493450.1 hypothetical protein [Micromonospora sp. 4G53]
MTAALDVDDVSTGGEWVTLAVPPDLDQAYRAVTGWGAPEPPVGLGTVVARLAWTRGRPMPPGGVLVEMTLRRLDIPPADNHWLARVDTDVVGVRDGRRRVRVTTQLRAAADGRDVADVDFLLDWPA